MNEKVEDVQEVVRTKNLEIVNDKGEMVAHLGIGKFPDTISSAMLVLASNRENAGRIHVGLDDQGLPSITLGYNDEVRLELDVNPEGQALVLLCDAQGKTAYGVMVDSAGTVWQVVDKAAAAEPLPVKERQAA